MNLTAIIRRFPALKVLSEASQAIRLTGALSSAVAQVEAAAQERSRAGRTFILGNSAAITGKAPVQVLVTTQAQWILWNPDPNNSYIFDEIGMYLTSGTPGVGGTLWGALFSAITTPITGANTTGLSVTSWSNGGSSSKMIAQSSAANVITTPAAPNWYCLAVNGSSQTATAFAASGGALEHRSIAGGLIVPPGQGLALAVVAPAGTTPLFAPFARWSEMPLDLE